VQEGTGTTVHDERAGGLRAARLGTVEPVPDALDLAATESAITAIFKRANSSRSVRRRSGYYEGMDVRPALRVLNVVVRSAFLLPALTLIADQVPVRHLEGRIHGFLVLRDLDDKLLASGSLIQLAHGNRVTTELSFSFNDGSVHQETSVFSQHRTFQLLTYHLVQKGPAFKRAIDMSLNASSGQVTIRYTDDDGKEKTITDRLKLPADLANGIVTTLLGDIDPAVPKTIVSMLLATPKPRLIKLEISPLGEDLFSVGGFAEKALRYAVKIDIGGISGLIAPIIGKQPPDTHVWMVGGKAPGFLKSEGPLFQDGPVWRIELASPVWPKTSPGQKQ